MTFRAIRSTRRVISAAARRENVISRIRRGSAPLTIRWATRCARVLVLPEPAPAMTRVREWVALDDREVRHLAGLNAAVIAVLAERLGNVEGGSLDRRHGWHPGLDI